MMINVTPLVIAASLQIIHRCSESRRAITVFLAFERVDLSLVFFSSGFELRSLKSYYQESRKSLFIRAEL